MLVMLACGALPAQMFGTFTSINPVWAAIAGWILLHQALDANERAGIGLIVPSNVVVSAGDSSSWGMGWNPNLRSVV